MTQLVPYLNFAGNCDEAFNFYKEALEEEIISFQRYDTSPIEIPEYYKNKVLHATIKFDEVIIMGADTMPGQAVNQGNTISISINLEDIEKAKKYFDNLSAGGSILMQFAETFWGATFGMFIDKFGINWMVNCEKQ